MSWETKFASIVQETENNLAKVKEKLRYKSSHSPVSGVFERTFENSSYRSSNLPVQTLYPVSRPKTCLAKQWCNPDNMYTNSTGLPQRRAMHLQHKIDEQDKTIEQLKMMVQTLQKERGEYRELTTKLSDEVNQLTSHVMDRSKVPNLEWQMNQMKRELSFDVKEVKNQLELFRSHINQRTPPDQTLCRHEQMNHDIHEEVNSLRSEVDTLRRRLDTFEIGMMTQYDRGRFSRVVENRSMHDTPDECTRRRVHILQTCPDADRNMERAQLDQLRRTVKSLNDQLCNVETRIVSKPTAMTNAKEPKPRRSFLTRTRTSQESSDFHVDSDWSDDDPDIDLSDAVDSDNELISSFVSKRSLSDNVHMDDTSRDLSDDGRDEDTLVSSVASANFDDEYLHTSNSPSMKGSDSDDF